MQHTFGGLPSLASTLLCSVAARSPWILSSYPACPLCLARPPARPACLQVFVFSARGGQHTQQASLGMECEQEGVADAVVFPTGVVALSPLRHLWWVLGGWGGGLPVWACHACSCDL